MGTSNERPESVLFSLFFQPAFSSHLRVWFGVRLLWAWARGIDVGREQWARTLAAGMGFGYGWAWREGMGAKRGQHGMEA